MPQMAPLNWLILMIMFIILFLLINMINYFSLKYNYKFKFNKKSQKLIWKW